MNDDVRHLQLRFLTLSAAAMRESCPERRTRLEAEMLSTVVALASYSAAPLGDAHSPAQSEPTIQ